MLSPWIRLFWESIVSSRFFIFIYFFFFFPDIQFLSELFYSMLSTLFWKTDNVINQDFYIRKIKFLQIFSLEEKKMKF